MEKTIKRYNFYIHFYLKIVYDLDKLEIKFYMSYLFWELAN